MKPIFFGNEETRRAIGARSLGIENREATIESLQKISRQAEVNTKMWKRTFATLNRNRLILSNLQMAGETSFRVVVEDDDHTTEACHRFSGQVFSISEARAGVNLPPFHYNCRCRIEGVGANSWEISREEEIDLMMAFLRYVSEWGDEEGGWRTRLATEEELRRIAEDLVDLLRIFERFSDGNGFLNLLSEDVHREFGLFAIHAVMRLSGYEPGSALRAQHNIAQIMRLHDSFGTGLEWPYVSVEMLFQLAMERAIPNSARQEALEVGTGFVITFGVLYFLPAFVTWLASPAGIATATGGGTTVAGMYWERLKAWLGVGQGVVPQFTNTAQHHLANPARNVPLQILMDAIRFGKSLPDPHGTAARAYYIVINKNGSFYNLQVIFDRATNTIWHFHYTREALGPLSAILR